MPYLLTSYEMQDVGENIDLDSPLPEKYTCKEVIKPGFTSKISPATIRFFPDSSDKPNLEGH